MEEMWSSFNASAWNRSAWEQDRFGLLDAMDAPADGSPALRAGISAVYALVCAVGLLGNLLVLILMKTRRGRERSSSINLLVLNLAVTDLQFVLTLPFWAADTALDFSWPFGTAMCKIVLSVTVGNMYASVFFLTAMSVSRYRAVAAAALTERRRSVCAARRVIAALWLCAAAASLPTALFATVRSVAGERLCLLGFPRGRAWLGLYQLQKVALAFVLPLLTVCASYLLLLRVVGRRGLRAARPRRRSRVTRSVAVVVVSFFLCWMPNHAVTLWGVLVKFNVVHWDRSFYLVHTYVHPVTVCLAHTNSCLNPLLYCLMRPEFRQRLSRLLWRTSTPRGDRGPRVGPRDPRGDIPLNHVDAENCRLSVLTVLTVQGDADALP